MKSIYGIVLVSFFAHVSSSHAAPITAIEAKSTTSSTYTAKPFYMIGIYEPNNEHGWKRDENGDFVYYQERGDATIYIEEQSSNDVVLSLGAYEPTDWTIKGPGADNVSTIIVHGYYNSTVKGHQATAVVHDYTYSSNPSDYIKTLYKWNSSNRQLVVSELENIANATVTSFTGLYNAESFVIDQH